MKFKKLITAVLLLVTSVSTAQVVSAASLDLQYLNPIVSYEAVNGAWVGWGDVARMRIDGKLGWCIEPQTAAHSGEGYNSSPSYSERMNLITAMASDLNAAGDDMYYTAALQMLHGEISWGWTYLSLGLGTTAPYIAAINQKINQWNTKPSFNGQTFTVKLGQSITLTDINNVLSGYSDLGVNNANVDFSINGNKLTITPKDTTKASGVLQFKRPTKYGTPLVWDKPDSQTIITLGDPDRPQFSVNLDIELTGKVRIQKLDKTTGKPVPNTTFHLKYTEGGVVKEYDLTTGADGYTPASVDIPNDTTVEVWETSVPEPYKLNSTHFTGKIKASETITLTQKNVLMPKFPRTGSHRVLLAQGLSVAVVISSAALLFFVKNKKRNRRVS